MKLQLKKFFSNEDEKPLSVAFALDLSDVEWSGVHPFEGPVEISVTARGKNGAVELELQAVYMLSVPCDRCAELIREKKSLHFHHLLLLAQEEQEEDGDYVRIPDGQLDVGELAREDLILSLPTRFLCREDCKGLCPVCGKNLNRGECTCLEKKVDPRMEILRKFFDD